MYLTIAWQGPEGFCLDADFYEITNIALRFWKPCYEVEKG